MSVVCNLDSERRNQRLLEQEHRTGKKRTELKDHPGKIRGTRKK